MNARRLRRPRLVAVVLLACWFPSAAPAQAAPRNARDRVVTRAAVESLARTSRTGTVIRVAGPKIDTVTGATADLALSPGEILTTAATVGRPKVDRVTSVPHFDLPERIFAPATSGDVVRLGVAIETNGLFYVPGDDVYIGTVRIGLVDDAQPSTTRTLASTVPVLLSAAGEITPDTLQLDHTNLPFQPVVIRAKVVDNDSLTVRIRPGFKPDGYAFRVHAHRPRIQLTVSPVAIDAFGLQRARVTVMLPADAGHDRTVSLAASRNDPIDGSLVLSAGETKSTRIASHGRGIDTVRASSPQLAPAVAELRYVFPTGFLVALAIGAAIGTVVRGAKTPGRGPAASHVRNAATALALGVLVAVAYAIGVNLIGVPLPSVGGEAVTLVGAALGAMSGESVMKVFADRRTARATAGSS